MCHSRYIRLFFLPLECDNLWEINQSTLITLKEIGEWILLFVFIRYLYSARIHAISQTTFPLSFYRSSHCFYNVGHRCRDDFCTFIVNKVCGKNITTQSNRINYKATHCNKILYIFVHAYHIFRFWRLSLTAIFRKLKSLLQIWNYHQAGWWLYF